MPKEAIKRGTILKALNKQDAERMTRKTQFVPCFELPQFVYDKERVHKAFATQLSKCHE
jgi:hypothetical protein